MADSPDPTADIPLFEGRWPWLAVPAIVILALSVRFVPRKPLFAPNTPQNVHKLRISSWCLICLQLINVVCAFWIYFSHDGPPLTPALPASEGKAYGALYPVTAIMFATISSLYSQLGLARLYFHASGGRGRRMLVALIVLAILPTIWVLGSLIALTNTWKGRKAVEEIEWMTIAQVFIIAFDTLLFVALHRLRQQATPDKAPQFARLYAIASLTQGLAIILVNLKNLDRLFGVYPLYEWLACIGGYLSAVELHLVTCFYMWRMLEADAGADVEYSALGDSVIPATEDVALIDDV